MAAARYRAFAGHQPPFSFTVFADSLFLSSGLLNVLLYVYTRPYLLPHSSDDSPDNQSEFAQSRSDHTGSPVFGNARIVESPIEPKSADPVHDAPEVYLLPITTRVGDRDIGHGYENSGNILVRRELLDDV